MINYFSKDLLITKNFFHVGGHSIIYEILLEF